WFTRTRGPVSGTYGGAGGPISEASSRQMVASSALPPIWNATCLLVLSTGEVPRTVKVCGSAVRSTSCTATSVNGSSLSCTAGRRAAQRDVAQADGGVGGVAAGLERDLPVGALHRGGAEDREGLRLRGEVHVLHRHRGERFLVELYRGADRDRHVRPGGEGQRVRRAGEERDPVLADAGVPRVLGAAGHVRAERAAHHAQRVRAVRPPGRDA